MKENIEKVSDPVGEAMGDIAQVIKEIGETMRSFLIKLQEE